MRAEHPCWLVIACCILPNAGLAHHSRAPYDLSTEVVFEGTIVTLDWRNPHVSFTVEILGPDGDPSLQDIEVLSVSESLALGLTREAISPGTEVVVRAHPGRRGLGARALGRDVTTSDGTLLPLGVEAGFAALPERPVEADGLDGRWAPVLDDVNMALGVVLGQWPFTEEARAGLTEVISSTDRAALGICADYPPPLLSIFPDLRQIEVADSTVVMRFEATGQNLDRVIHLDQMEHPANIAPSLLGHSIGWWEGETLVVDTVAFEPHPVGVSVGVPSSPGKRIVERLTLTSDRHHLRYDLSLDDPASLTDTARLSMRWAHRPDLAPSGVECDPELARRMLGDH